MAISAFDTLISSLREIEQEYATVPDASKILGISESTLYQWQSYGFIRKYEKSVVHIPEVIDHIEENCEIVIKMRDNIKYRGKLGNRVYKLPDKAKTQLKKDAKKKEYQKLITKKDEAYRKRIEEILRKAFG